jgi:hypothetical protein
MGEKTDLGTEAVAESGPGGRSSVPTEKTAEVKAPPPEDQTGAARALGIEDRRIKFAYRLGGAGMLCILILLIISFLVLHYGFADPGKDRDFKDVSALRWTYIFSFVKAGTHAIITIATIWFFYQIVRAAERMALPWHWMSSHPETARALLGIQDPSRAALRATKDVLRAAEGVVDKTVDRVAKLTGAAKKIKEGGE